MFELPSIWNLIISAVAFFVAAWYIRRYLDENGIPKGMTRNMLVLVLASAVSWGAGAAADWAQAEISGPQPVAQTPDSLSQMLKEVGQPQP